ncbi:hypothetical protein GFB49_14195 [Epibacterium sp. SM1979]|uniref:Glycoamylase-like domain-containing protein n=1 Tax=Tritonibacter litoralis TaxID=2662264 RepID=A0A843YJK6_9RHOB|nr:hypothetical protein [Tritonibacter litoralis]MQQ09614.1 hypothetical protein [Tritonibacter litoralis]
MLRVLFCALIAAAPVQADELDAFAAERLQDAVLLFDQEFRNDETGQYLDSIRLDDRNGSPLSSIAASGMGLISLAIGDATGVIPDADTKAETTLEHLLGLNTDTDFAVKRSANGWYRHWFNVHTGAVPKGSKEKYSTIDTAILSAGAAILGNYLTDRAERNNTPIPRAARLAHQLVMSINWTTAIRDPQRGSIHLVFYGAEAERPTDNVATIPFDEYALLPCMAARFENLTRNEGDATLFWHSHFDDVKALPMPKHESFTLLGKPSGNVPSHFTHQFAFYLCGDYARDPIFLEELRELKKADRQWFESNGTPAGLWGLGAGSEIVFDQNNQIEKYRYGVARLGENPNKTASPAIMAGFLPVNMADGTQTILAELKALWDTGACRYEHEDLEFMWRCSAKDPSLQVKRLEAIDFSTWMLGLATVHPDVGLAFFQDYAF